jgi:hypothetical protein
MTHIDAQRAIYIDFEYLQRQPPQKPHPALLGVLIGAADEDFEQLITDDRLAPARIVLKATREREAWRAYERTRFCVDDGKRRICFMAGSQSRRLDSLLERHAADRWAFITAWNPASELLTPAENHARQARLRTAVASYSMLPGEGIGKDPAWTPEESLLVLNISRREAIRLGRQFGQLAIVAGRRGSKSRLVSCAKPPRPARRNPVAGR